MTKDIRSNIWKYALILISNKRIFVAILGAYYLTVPGSTAQTVGFLLLAGNLSSFLLEIPSGYMSDKLGHKQALVTARVLMLMSTTFFLFSDSVALLFLGSIFLSASFAFHSGTGSAFMHETLRALGRDNEYSKVMGKLSSIGFAVPIVFMVLVPFLVDISYQVPFMIALVTDFIGFVAAVLLVSPPVSPEQIEEVNTTNFRQVMREGYRLNYFCIALFSGLVGGVLFVVGGFRAPYQLFLEIPVIWYGVFFGIGRAGASLLLAYSGKIKTYFTLPSFYRFKMIIFTVMILILGLVDIGWVVVGMFILTNTFNWGLSQVDTGYKLEVIKSSKFKATLLSTSAQIESLISAALAFGMGIMIERFSYQAGFLYLGILFVLAAWPLSLYIARQFKDGAYGQSEPVEAGGSVAGK